MTTKDLFGFSEMPLSLVLLGLARRNYVVATLTTILAFILLRGFYNRYLHPLRDFPGPFWGSLTDFYKLFIISRMDAHTRGLKLHEKYGQERFLLSSLLRKVFCTRPKKVNANSCRMTRTNRARSTKSTSL